MSAITLEYVDNIPELDNGLYGSQWDEALDEFVASGRPLAKLRDIPAGKAGNIRWAAERRRLPVKVRTQRGEIYLVRSEEG